MTMAMFLRDDQKRKLKFEEDFPDEAKLLKKLRVFLNECSVLKLRHEKINRVEKKLMCDNDADLQRWYVKMGGGENSFDINLFEELYHEEYYDPTIKYLANKKTGDDTYEES